MADWDSCTLTMPLTRGEATAPTAQRDLQASTDENRLMLHVALTATGVPPAPEDMHTIRQLAEMDGTAVETVVRWLRYAAQSTMLGSEERDRAGGAEPGAEAPGGADVQPRLDEIGDLGALGDDSHELDGFHGVEELGDLGDLGELGELGELGTFGELRSLADIEDMPLLDSPMDLPPPTPASMVDPRLMSW